jgi:hypothetical protein
MFFVCADSTELTNALSGSADSKGLAGGQFRPKHGETWCWSGSADSDGDRGMEVNEAKEVEEVKEKQIPASAGKPPFDRDVTAWGSTSLAGDKLPGDPTPPLPRKCRIVRKPLKTKGRKNEKQWRVAGNEGRATEKNRLARVRVEIAYRGGSMELVGDELMGKCSTVLGNCQYILLTW